MLVLQHQLQVVVALALGEREVHGEANLAGDLLQQDRANNVVDVDPAFLRIDLDVLAADQGGAGGAAGLGRVHGGRIPGVKRMRRILLNTAAAVSLLLCLAAGDCANS